MGCSEKTRGIKYVEFACMSRVFSILQCIDQIETSTSTPWAVPGNLTRSRAQGGGNFTSVVVVGVGNLF